MGLLQADQRQRKVVPSRSLLLELGQQCIALQARLSTLLDAEVQVVPVNRAPADLVRRVLRDGTLLVDRSPATRVAFEVRKRNEYFDMTPTWRRIRHLPPGVEP